MNKLFLRWLVMTRTLVLGFVCWLMGLTHMAVAESLDPFAGPDTGDVFGEGTPDARSFRRDMTLTLTQDYAYGISGQTDRTVENRTSLRGELGTSLWRGVFVRFDGKASLFWSKDSRLDKDGASPDYGGDIREAYIQKENDRMSVNVGKQVVVWGETDGEVVNDVVSPRDEREIVFVNLEDARLGLPLASVTFYFPWGDLFSFVSLSSAVNETPVAGTYYDRTPQGIVIQDEMPHDSDREFGVKWKKTFHGFDLSLMAASLNQNSGVLEYASPGVLRRTYPRYRFFGLGARAASGNFLFNVDLSCKDRFGLQAVDSEGFYHAFQGRVFDHALGIEYDANGACRISLEVTHRQVQGGSNETSSFDRDITGWYASMRRLFIHDTLTAQYSFFHQHSFGHSIHKAGLEYRYSDHLTLMADVTLIQAKDRESPLWPFRREDRMGVGMSYCF